MSQRYIKLTILVDTHNSVCQLPTVSALLRKRFQNLDRLAAMDLGETMTNGLKASKDMAYDTVWVELWQTRGRCTPGLHNVSEDVYILAAAYYQQHQHSVRHTSSRFIPFR